MLEKQQDATSKGAQAAEEEAAAQEQRLRHQISSCVRTTLALRKDQHALLDVFADLLLADVASNRPGTTSDTSGAASPSTTLPILCGSDLPASEREAEAAWGPLLTSTLGLDDAEPADLAHACAQLLDALGAAAAQLEEEAGLAGQRDQRDEEGGGALEEGACEMCERVMPLTKHHLIPRCEGRKLTSFGSGGRA